MARIPDEVLKQLKEQVDLVDLVVRSGVALKKTGQDFVGTCPFHEDKTPSLVVTPKKGLWHCMGACQSGGSPIDWVMKTQGVSFRHAVELLRSGDRASLSRAKLVKATTIRHLPSPVDLEANDELCLSQVVSYYNTTLKECAVATEYLFSRKIYDPEAIECFKLGYADRTLGLHIANKNRLAGAEIRGRLKRLGVYRQSGHEHLAGSLVIPVIGSDGVVRELYGRKIKNNRNSLSLDHLYLPGAHRGVFNEQGLVGGEVILTESLIDALTMWCHGIRNVTASYGVGGFTKDHDEAFKRYNVRRVLIAYDNDEAGRDATKALADRLGSDGIECFSIKLPYDSDINDVACLSDKPHDALSRLVRDAQWLGTTKPKNTQQPKAKARNTSVVEPSVSSLAALDPATSDSNEPDSNSLPLPTTQPRVEKETLIVEPPTPTPTPPVELPLPTTQPRVEKETLIVEPPTPTPTPPVELPLPTTQPRVEKETLIVEPAISIVTPVPNPPKALPVALCHDELVIEMAPRRWRVRHIPKGQGSMRVNVIVQQGERFHIDSLDLYQAKARSAFCDSGATEIHADAQVLRAELTRVLLAVEEAQLSLSAKIEDEPPEMTSKDRELALEFLESPDLIEQVSKAFEVQGVVGERDSALVGWLTLVSRLSDRPLGAVIQSSSSAGKSTLADAVLSLIPKEHKVFYSAMTGQALYYLGESDLCHKVLAIAEEQGANRASYALKLLVSEGRLAIAAAGKDPTTGRLSTNTYEVNGPVALFMTTTQPELDEELSNRLLVLSVDEGRAQTRAVQSAQRVGETLKGLVDRTKRAELISQHHAAQRLLSAIAVVNPYAPDLSFSDRSTRNRRDNAKYLGLIRAVTLCHQHQRPKKQISIQGRFVTYIETSEQDVITADKLCSHVLNTTTDELAPPTRKLLEATQAFVKDRGDRVFTRRSLREATGIGDTQMKVNLARLVDLEYVSMNRAGPATTYELICDYDFDRSDNLANQSDIARLVRRSVRDESIQLEGTESKDPNQSVGIGRVTSRSDRSPLSKLKDPNSTKEANRSAFREIRVLGEENQAGIATS